MTEYWVCESCKSLVRGTTTRCYSCQALRPADARELDMGIRGAVVTPGIDNGLQDVAFTLAEGRQLVPTGILAGLVILGVGVGLLATLAEIGISVYLGVTFVASGPSVLPSPELVAASLVVAIVSTVAFIASLVGWLVFQGVSMYNAPLLGAGNSRNSIPGALAWWFVPILNIWIPARIVADLHARLGSKGSSGQLVMGIWWATYVASAFFGPILTVILTVSAVGFGLAGLAGVSFGISPTLDRVTIGSTLLGLVQKGLLVVSGIAFGAVVLDLHGRQAERRRWLAEGRERFIASAAEAAAAAGGAPTGPLPGGSAAIG